MPEYKAFYGMCLRRQCWAFSVTAAMVLFMVLCVNVFHPALCLPEVFRQVVTRQLGTLVIQMLKVVRKRGMDVVGPLKFVEAGHKCQGAMATPTNLCDDAEFGAKGGPKASSPRRRNKPPVSASDSFQKR